MMKSILSFRNLHLDNNHRRQLLRHTLVLRRIVRRHASEQNKEKVDVAFTKYENIPVSNIRNFSIIAHIDHGKSTLADRLLEITGTLDVQPGNAQVLDRLQVEKERGITVKAVTASLQYVSKKDNQEYLLNLVDTPGHSDFANEVSRAIAACQSVILLIDANQGVQAQTFSNFYLAFVNDLIIIPVINKIDLKNAKPEVVEEQLQNLFDIEKKDVLRISAKLGIGIEDLLEHIIEKAPPPPSKRDAPLRALLFDTWFVKYEGVVLLFYIKDGEIKEGDTIVSHHTGNSYVVKHVGIVRPNEYETGILRAGQVGYITCQMRSIADAHIGDTFYLKDEQVEPFPGFKPARPMVFAGIYPADRTQQNSLQTAIQKLVLTDSAVTVTPENSPALGFGWRLGFLGLLHLEVFNQRLDQEYDAQTIMTAPSVTYKVRIMGKKNIKEKGGEELVISNPTEMPDLNIVTEILEPVILGTVIFPNEYINDVISLCVERRGTEKSITIVDDSRSMAKYVLPLNEVIVDFHDKLKSITSGYASFDYEDYGYSPADLLKVDILVHGEIVDELSVIVHRSKARDIGRRMCKKLSEIIPKKQFKIAIQAAIGSKIIARETIRALGKNVLDKKMNGADAIRKLKLVRHQAECKQKMRMVGKVEVPRDAFIKLLQTD